MTATLVAGVTSPGALNPITLECLGSAGAQLSANVTAALALQAQAQIGAPPLTAQLTALLEAEAALQAGIALGLPGVTFSVSAAATLVASAQAALGVLGQLTALLGSAGIFVYEYSGGTVATLGADLTAGLVAQPPPGLAPGDAVAGVLVGAGASTWVGVQPYFGGLG